MSPHLIASLLGPSRPDGGLHILAFLGRRQHGSHPE
jgi:hypothetical protein